MAAVLLPIGQIAILASLSSFAALLAFLAVNASLIVLRYRQPDHPRPFQVPLHVGRLPILPVLAIASITVLLLQFDWPIYVAGVLALGLTAAAFVIRRIFQGFDAPRSRGSRFI